MCFLEGGGWQALPRRCTECVFWREEGGRHCLGGVLCAFSGGGQVLPRRCTVCVFWRGGGEQVCIQSLWLDTCMLVYVHVGSGAS